MTKKLQNEEGKILEENVGKKDGIKKRRKEDKIFFFFFLKKLDIIK